MELILKSSIHRSLNQSTHLHLFWLRGKKLRLVKSFFSAIKGTYQDKPSWLWCWMMLNVCCGCFLLYIWWNSFRLCVCKLLIRTQTAAFNVDTSPRRRDAKESTDKEVWSIEAALQTYSRITQRKQKESDKHRELLTEKFERLHTRRFIHTRLYNTG